MQHHGAEARNQLRELSEPASTWTEQQRVQLAEDLAPLFLSIGDFSRTETLATLVARAEPSNLRSRLLLMDIALETKQLELLKQTIEEIRIIEGQGANGAIWHFGEALRLNLMGRETKDPQTFAAALAHLKQAQVERPTWERIPLLMAEILDQQGKTMTRQNST